MKETIDHLIYGAATLEAGIKTIEELFGVRPIIGGQHRGRGTHNALLSLGEGIYFEIIAPDPLQPEVPRPYWIDTDAPSSPGLIRWAAKSNDLNQLEQIVGKHQIPLGTISSGNRTRPNGEILSWRLTEPAVPSFDGLMPFFLDWGKTQHPSSYLPSGGKLLSFKGQHPQAEKIQQQLDWLGVNFMVEKGTEPKLIAEIETRKGVVVLK